MSKIPYDRQKYLDYIKSAEWLVKKSRLVNVYLRRGWEIKCNLCEAQSNLQVHHLTYKNLYKEKYDDLTFLCRDCHSLSYTDKKEFEKRGTEKFFEVIRFFEKNPQLLYG